MLAGGAAVDREAAERAGVRQAAHIHSRREVEDRAGVALEQRHALEEFAIDDCAGGGRLGLKQRSHGSHLDGLGDGADLHGCSDRDRCADSNVDAVLYEPLEAGCCDRYAIRAWFKRRHAEKSFGICLSRGFKVCFGIDRAYLRSRYDGAARVVDLCRKDSSVLRPRRNKSEQHKHRYDSNKISFSHTIRPLKIKGLIQDNPRNGAPPIADDYIIGAVRVEETFAMNARYCASALPWYGIAIARISSDR